MHRPNHKNEKRTAFAAVSKLILFLLLIVALCNASSALHHIYPHKETHESHPFQLSKSILPTAYNLSITSHIPALAFEGMVNISISVLCHSSSITLHSRDLNITKVTLLLNGLTHILNVFHLPDDILHLTKPSFTIPNGNMTLFIEYNGLMSDTRANGFFRSMTDDGHWIATTNFEPFSARSAFPCFDTPYFKTSYSISVIHPSIYNAHSNGKRVEYSNANEKSIGRRSSIEESSRIVSNGNEYSTTQFETTIPLSRLL